MGRIFPFALVALAMVSCSETDLASAEAEAMTQCGAQGQQNLVGQTVEDLAAVSFASAVTRFINPGDVVTQDVRPERMNIEFGEDGKISRVYCG